MSELMAIPDTIEQIHINNFIKGFIEILNQEEKPLEFSGNKNTFALRFYKIVKIGALSDSQQKIRRFQKILLGEIQKTYNSDFFDTFLHLTESLNDTHIRILLTHKNGDPIIQENLKTMTSRGVIDGGDMSKETKTGYLHDFQKSDFYSLEKKQYQFYVQDLISKSLLYDEGMNRITYPPFSYTRITSFGEEYLRFLQEYNAIDGEFQ
ncbi:MAG: hypothetical protein GXY18_15205 [Methanomicrobiales archaeon]|nr:hypothetical protein [Methanomicrobiales archaeon]